jgi:hypothetical protein
MLGQRGEQQQGREVRRGGRRHQAGEGLAIGLGGQRRRWRRPHQAPRLETCTGIYHIRVS